jgi:peptide/nickel transport system ATP-binding protein
VSVRAATDVSAAASAPLLVVRELSVEFGSGERPVESISYELARGEALALVGESGCGKTLSALALIELLPAGARAAGALLWRGEPLRARAQRLRGREIGCVFQDPQSSLNPVLSIGAQLGAVLRTHRGLRGGAARARAQELLEQAGLPDARAHLRSHPHQLSGGMRQRAAIACALAGEPSLLIADEPTSALDLGLQAQLFALLARLRRDRGLALLLVTHDLAAAAHAAERVCVVYAGRVVESGAARDVLSLPRHPYTQALVNALPGRGAPRTPLAAIPGAVPPVHARPSGCAFRTRCERASERCARELPLLLPSRAIDATRTVACHHPLEDAPPAPAGARA